MTKAGMLILALLAFAVPACAQTTDSLFDRYRTSVPATFPSKPMTFEKMAAAYRTQLQKAFRKPPNFAGQYVVVTWGCGGGCVSGGLLDLLSGEATLLPWSVTICCYDGHIRPPERLEPIQVRADSRLIILNGMLNEQGRVGRHMFERVGGQFRPLGMIPDDGSFRQATGFGALPAQ